MTCCEHCRSHVCVLGRRAVVMTLILMMSPCRLWPQVVEEYQIKSVYLERFTRFIDWPENSAVNDTAIPFIIGVVGRNPFGSILEKDYAHHRIKDKRVEIRYCDDLERIEGCHLLFIADSEKHGLDEILERVRGKAVLMVGDTQGFAHAGVHINFYRSGDKIRFKINIDAVREAGLEVASLLLDYAQVVREGGER
ncbi:MAG: DUF4154 domain-containing protein [Chitinivibrionales bacterium]|nr:DUF4154 domain-containing protein [Chitinivibrionales bacterium]MBD3355916.1 DUF4154 domain-containing protein [Chitinivibrionales bacterium]